MVNTNMQDKGFSSTGLKVQVSFSDHLSSIICPSVCKLFTFSSSPPEPLGQFQHNLAQNIFGERGFSFIQGEIIKK